MVVSQWRRHIEYQSRGSAHAHICARIKNFVNLDALYELAKSGHREGATVDEIREGESAELELCRIADQFCCALAVDPAGDALLEIRTKAVFDADSVHPASFIHEDPTLEMLRFGDLLNKVQRHAHVKTYCGCDADGCGKCRFHAPWRIANATSFEWTMTENGPNGCLQYRRNDRWMNSYHPVGMQAWNANMDIKLIYNIECLADYLCAYATKCEKLSKQALRMMSACTRNFDDTTGIQKIVRSMFIRGHGQRDMSAQEVAHCNLNMPLVRQNVKYITVDLRKGNGVGGRRLDLDDNVSSMVVPSIMECFHLRALNFVLFSFVTRSLAGCAIFADRQRYLPKEWLAFSLQVGVGLDARELYQAAGCHCGCRRVRGARFGVLMNLLQSADDV